jgi:hypothetical protein
VTVAKAGKGRVIVGAADYWMTDKLAYAVPEIVNMEPPYRMPEGVRALLSRYFGSFSPVTVSPGGLTVRTCLYEKEPKRLLVGLFNNDLFADWKGKVAIRTGTIHSARELWHGQTLPAGKAVPLTVAAGDVAMVEILLN